MNFIIKRHQGFTLIELLVVIAIILFIAAVVMNYVHDATVRGRDARRRENIDQITKAINLYFNEKGYLPRNSTGWCTYISNPTNGWGSAFQADIAPYMKNIQLDPTKAGQVGDYFYDNINNNNGNYVLCANMEMPTGQSYDYSSCSGGTVYNYCITQ